MASLDKLFKENPAKKPDPHPRRETKWIHYTKLKDNAAQYCNEKDKEEIVSLASLIHADKGVLQNLLVRKTDTDEYEIIAGHKRRRACAYLVEEEGRTEYEFLPCSVENISDVRAEFQLYSSNSHHEKTDYERMHELERMKFLLENHPDEFPHLKTGRMVERLAQQMHMSRTAVGDYLTISKNLSDTGKEAFAAGELTKSAALELAALPEEEQDKLIEQGTTGQKAIRTYKEEEKRPSEQAVRKFYEDVAWVCDTDRSQLKDQLIRNLGRIYAGAKPADADFCYSCSPRGIRLNNSTEITWACLVKLIEEYFPKEGHPSEQQPPEQDGAQLPGQLRVANTDMELTEEENVPESGTLESHCKETETPPLLSKEPLSAFGTPKTQYPEGSLLSTPGCGRGIQRHSCFMCSQECVIRQEDRRCVEAPCGNPFPCETMLDLSHLRSKVGDSCQFVQLDLAPKRAGDHEPVPCCKECDQTSCAYRCLRARGRDIEKPEGLQPESKSLSIPDQEPERASEPTEQAAFQTEEQAEEKYPPKFFLDEAQDRLNQMLVSKERGEVVPEIALERQKMIVAALADMVCSLKRLEYQEQLEEMQKKSQPELPQLKNDDQRKQWLRNYKEWGVWYTDEHIGATFYKYDFDDGTRLIAEEYEDTYSGSALMHLVGGPKKRKPGPYGVPKYPYHSRYCRREDCETELVEFLKAIQKK